MEVLALILAGGKGSRLDLLSSRRSKPAMPFAGKYRIIDFTLSNCSQSGIYDIAILTQYLPLSLNEHIGSGKPWDLDRNNSSVVLLQPHTMWYEGTADAVLKNLKYVKSKNPRYVLILSGDHIYKMNYKKMLQTHKDNNASLTIATQEVDEKDVSRFGMMSVDKNNKIVKFEEKPEKTDARLASMGIYIFNTDVLIDAVENLDNENLDFGKHVIPYLIEKTNEPVFAHKFSGYWRDVGTYDSYLDTNLEINKAKFELDLYDPTWKIFTKSEERPPVKILNNALIKDSLISNGCIIEGTVINSVLSPGVRIGKGSVVKDSVIMNDTIISTNVKLEKVIIDKRVVIGHNVEIGVTDDNTPNISRPDLLDSGITIVEKGTIIPSNLKIGKNCRIHRGASFDENVIKSGSTL